jgi:hypothetical protein
MGVAHPLGNAQIAGIAEQIHRRNVADKRARAGKGIFNYLSDYLY